MIGEGKNTYRNISIHRNAQYPEIQIKVGENQYSRHSHIHQVWSFSYVLHGKTSVSIGPERSELENDQFITLPPGIPHLCSPEMKKPFGFAVLYVPIRYLNIPGQEILALRIGKIESQVVFGLFDQFTRAGDAKELDSASRMVQKLLKENSSPVILPQDANLLLEQSQRTLPKGSRFQRYRYIRKHYGISEKKISTIGKMKQAERLMAKGVDLVDIALSCGFYDQSHFNKVFKLYTGLTPVQYMK